MNSQVLARKWRPQNFDDIIGQKHVVQAMKHSLATKIIHPSWILSGSRGIGKTTLARIFAMGLNCKKGITNKPCNQCNICCNIKNNTLLDVIELDSAFKTKVEDIRDILDTINYLPVQSRYKIYIFDEFHMLSKHSFNALLKIIEEPPQHVKFIFATTELHKIPITIQSRCIQFHLKLIEYNLIIKKIKNILDLEHICFDINILPIIAYTAQGSMRDALSLTNQLIAMGDLSTKNLHTILGIIDSKHIYLLLSALKNKSNNKIFDLIDHIRSFAVDWENIITRILLLLHSILKIKMLHIENNKNILHNVNIDIEEIYYQKLLDIFTIADIIFLNKIFIHGKVNLYLSPTPQIGFEQIILEAITYFNK
ncbi:DNA polymerase III subunit gamma/tau [Enterobacteriaceae endosymbiont of Macroplea mutica]|uniref:DNA polymerase III subunit gamma/tau n=1 Tax=Enterobacteriaceae endosymbiont of Macroplea mutica TaxID=2675791 RepID=UPI001448E8A8|nr:DNA polymerase III subunit gamma/tau [Enterobacteriaceae endosymbiont of Macroplea mutica]QJC31354.1 DNA polymerase III subunit gamma/tau [Enterobacteriaceae endosymbiont of Macroplea mutica]